jgi:hypothetical protein
MLHCKTQPKYVSCIRHGNLISDLPAFSWALLRCEGIPLLITFEDNGAVDQYLHTIPLSNHFIHHASQHP